MSGPPATGPSKGTRAAGAGVSAADGASGRISGSSATGALGRAGRGGGNGVFGRARATDGAAGGRASGGPPSLPGATPTGRATGTDTGGAAEARDLPPPNSKTVAHTGQRSIVTPFT